jgi:hypothetical protein
MEVQIQYNDVAPFPVSSLTCISTRKLIAAPTPGARDTEPPVSGDVSSDKATAGAQPQKMTG